MSNPEIIIVGAGSAGCLLAHRLAAQGRSVVVVEPPSEIAPAIDWQRPARWLHLLESDEDWDFPTGANPNLSGRMLRWPRGRGLGGSNRINAMIWFPPTEEDLEEFAGYSAFAASALRQSLDEVESVVRPESPRWLSPASRKFLESVESVSGFQPAIYRRVNRNGRRWTPAELLRDPRIQVVRSTVDQILLEGDKAAGVRLAGGESIRCSDTVCLCAGAIGTPTILIRSGIGPRDVLVESNIDVRFEAPGVGQNLQDHLVMPIVFAVDARTRFPTDWSVRELAQWQTMGSGPLSCNIAECGGLTADGTIQVHVTPTHYLTYPSPESAPAMTIAVNVCKPKSRGRLRIDSTDPVAAPIIEPEYLADESDLQTTIQAVRLARRMTAQQPLLLWTNGELLPGAKRDSDEAIARSIRRYARTLYHPVGTCAVGDVVDEHLQLKGVKGLHVVDGSVLKEITTGNPNAMIMTIANAAFG